MNYEEFHNHKWAKNLKYARKLLAENRLDVFYNGEDLPDKDGYPGMRVMAAYWVSVEYEMKLRMKTLLIGAKQAEWESDAEILSQWDEFCGRYLSDMRELVVREDIVPIKRMDSLAGCGWETPADWAEVMHDWQIAALSALEAGSIAPDLIETWFDPCLRSVATTTVISSGAGSTPPPSSNAWEWTHSCRQSNPPPSRSCGM